MGTQRMVTLTLGIGEDAKGNKLTGLDYKLKLLRKALANTFGGYTENNTRGGWVNPKGKLVTERTKTYTIATDKPIKTIVKQAAIARDLLKQHSVFLVVDNKPMFV